MKKRVTLLSMLLCVALTPVVLTATGCRRAEYSRSTGQYLDDKAISTKVKSSLLTSSGVPGTSIEVTTFDRVVQLSGFVDTAAQKDRAEQLARSVAGVRAVKNNIVLRPDVMTRPPTPPGTTPATQPGITPPPPAR